MISLLCSTTIMVNLSLFPWNKNDFNQKQLAERRCGEIYKASPCLVKFTKTSKRDYKAICGTKK